MFLNSFVGLVLIRDKKGLSWDLRLGSNHNCMKWIGLTGGIGSGKSTATEILRGLGVPVIDADELARRALEPNHEPYRLVVAWLGESVLGSNKEIDRAKLAEKVFKSSESRLKLEQIVHPWVQDEVRKKKEELRQQNYSFAIYDVPLLFEKDLEAQFDQTLLISSSESTQRNRLKARNGWSDQQITDRLQAQLSMEEKRKRAHVVIENEGTKEELKSALQQWLAQFK